MAKKKGKKSRKSQKSSKKSQKDEEPEVNEDFAEETDKSPEQEDSKESEVRTEYRSDRAGLRIFLVLLIILGLFIPISAYVEMRVASESNVKYAVTNMAMNLCEMETDNPSQNCARSQISDTEFREDYSYGTMIDDVVNLVYYGGGKATDYMASQQKAFVSVWRMKNIHEYSKYMYAAAILAVIGLIFLFVLFYHRGEVLAGSLYSAVNITLFLLFLWHSINFVVWIGYVPRVLSVLAKSSGESLRALVFGADFGFSLAKLHLFVAVLSLIIFIVIIVIRRSRSK
ncbi:hypothetical protein GF345_04465 [Candidatus Woesearchaeota archaeon]|nr:hypothetical protein [Candidatus Woesearchaeota archaeon]